MFIFTWKETGETIIFPTPDDKECEIEPLPKNWKRDLEMDKEWLEFHKKKEKKITQRTDGNLWHVVAG